MMEWIVAPIVFCVVWGVSRIFRSELKPLEQKLDRVIEELEKLHKEKD